MTRSARRLRTWMILALGLGLLLRILGLGKTVLRETR